MAGGIAHHSVVSSSELLTKGGNRDWCSCAVVFDDAGHSQGVAAAEYRTGQGIAVTLVTSYDSFASRPKPALSDEAALERLAASNTSLLITYGQLIAVSDSKVELKHHFGGSAFAVEAKTTAFCIAQ